VADPGAPVHCAEGVGLVAFGAMDLVRAVGDRYPAGSFGRLEGGCGGAGNEFELPCVVGFGVTGVCALLACVATAINELVTAAATSQ